MTSRPPSHPAEPEPPGSPLTLSGGTVARDLVCFSHLRWNFVFQRPNHLMARAARDRRVFYVEEPVVSGPAAPHLASEMRDGVMILTPCLPDGIDAASQTEVLRTLIDGWLRDHAIDRPVLWYYTP